MNMVNAGQDVYFLGIKVQLLSYTSSVIPIILSIWIASYVQKFFDKYLPIVVRNLFSPMFTIVIMVPLTLLAFGPIGNTKMCIRDSSSSPDLIRQFMQLYRTA